MNPAIDEQDRLDMQRLVAGHDAALNDLMERHSEKLFHYLIRQLQNESDAAEFAQETFVRIYQNRAKFRPNEKFSTWLYAIATNFVRDRFRKQQRHPQVSLDVLQEEEAGLGDKLAEETPTPAELLVAEERAEQVRLAISQLPEELRTPLILCEYEQLSHAEIGTILNCSAKAVETRIYRARNQLRALLGKILQGT